MACKDLCPLCLQNRELQQSHILPNAIFKRIKKESSGKLISLTDENNSQIHYSQDSWSEKLLCSQCEATICNYETYAFQLLRGARIVKTIKHTDGLTFQNHNYEQFKLFLTSLLWRMAVSNQTPFAKVVIPDYFLEKARLSILYRQVLGPFTLGCKLARIKDSTPKGNGGFSMKVLKGLIISPIPRLYDDTNYYSFILTFEGFLFEFFVPNVPKKKRKQRGIHIKSPILYVPFIEITEVDEIFNFLIEAYDKNQKGQISFKR